jgi:hypothetical protein
MRTRGALPPAGQRLVATGTYMRLALLDEFLGSALPRSDEERLARYRVIENYFLRRGVHFFIEGCGLPVTRVLCDKTLRIEQCCAEYSINMRCFTGIMAIEAANIICSFSVAIPSQICLYSTGACTMRLGAHQ